MHPKSKGFIPKLIDYFPFVEGMGASEKKLHTREALRLPTWCNHLGLVITSGKYTVSDRTVFSDTVIVAFPSEEHIHHIERLAMSTLVGKKVINATIAFLAKEWGEDKTPYEWSTGEQ